VAIAAVFAFDLALGALGSSEPDMERALRASLADDTG
jgi:hypothetical protein